jgi:hypothetical protein
MSLHEITYKNQKALLVCEMLFDLNAIKTDQTFMGGGMIIGVPPSPSPPLTHVISFRSRIWFSERQEMNLIRSLPAVFSALFILITV